MKMNDSKYRNTFKESFCKGKDINKWQLNEEVELVRQEFVQVGE